MRLISFVLIGSCLFQSCGMWPIPDEHVEIEFDMQSKHVPKNDIKE